MVDRKQEILDDMQAARAAVLEVAGRLSPAQLERPTTNEGWSARDTLAHLASIEVRIRSLLQHALEGRPWPADSPDLDTYNDRCVIERRSWTAERLVDELRASGRETERLVAGLAPGDLDREWDHPTRGRVTVETLARIVPRHLRTHAEQLEAAVAD